jgi:hypothetical protein
MVEGEGSESECKKYVLTGRGHGQRLARLLKLHSDCTRSLATTEFPMPSIVPVNSSGGADKCIFDSPAI